MAVARCLPSRDVFLKQIRDSITYAFQPIVNIHTGDCFGVEALLRNHKSVGVDSIPALFDRAWELGVLQQADSIFREVAVRRFESLPLGDDTLLFFNIDGRVFDSPGHAPEETIASFRDLDVRRESFCLELSEAYNNESARYVGDILKVCREQGFRLAIDDFGRGFSEMKMLYQHRPDFVKIDRFFINGIPDDSKKRLFVSTIVDLAHVLGAVVIAEGVETEGEFLSCKEIGCDLVQGFYIARPTTDLGVIHRTYAKIAETNRRDRRKRETDAHLIRKWMSSPPTLNVHAQIDDVREALAANITHTMIPVLNDAERPIGVVSRAELAGIVGATQSSCGELKSEGTNLLEHRVIRCPIADINNDIQTILEMYGSDREAQVVVVTETSTFAGILDADSLLRLLKEESLAAAQDRSEVKSRTSPVVGATVLGSSAMAASVSEGSPPSQPPVKGVQISATGDSEASQAAADAHEELFAEAQYPSASTCGTCHPKHFREWSVSQHAYSQLSPVYLSLSNKINELSNGSNGDFCLRCHNQVGANLGEDQFASNLTRHPTSREGITCVVCHRLNKSYNKASGRLALVEGDLTSPVFGPTGNKEMARVLSLPGEYKVQTDADKPGRKIHKEAKQFAAISTPMFCGTCHDVTLFNGFRLEEAFSEYRTSPAAERGVTCQDCHMGKEQGVASGYEHGPAANVGGIETTPRKLTSHAFAGPDYSVLHPGIFPHNIEAQEIATLEQWLQFDVKAGWGTDEFEDDVSDDHEFPERWAFADDRYEARDILEVQFEKLEWATQKRLEVLRNGYVLGDIVTERSDAGGIAFKVQIRNGTDGHNVPTGFTGERLVWLEVTVRDREGKVVFVSGDRDPNGDLRDGHSSYVHAGEAELDQYLLSLQSYFVTQNGRGGEIEHVIPIPYPIISLPRVLPSPVSLVFTGEPATERNHKRGIEPNGERWGSYEVKADAMTGKGTYKATVKLFSQPAPVNLLIAMQSVGFDYGLTPAQARDALVAGTQLLWEREVKFEIN